MHIAVFQDLAAQIKKKNGSYVLANQNADFKSRLKLVLEHAHESSL